MMEVKDAVSAEAKILIITKLYNTSWRKMAKTVHMPFKVIAFDANGIKCQRYELSKQLQDLHIDVAVFSETCLEAR
jgi:hypothetical protein